NKMGAIPCAGLSGLRNGNAVRVAGLITVRQRPGTAKGVLFVTIEDETGFANLVVWQSVFEEYRREIVSARLFMVEGKVQIEGRVVHVIANKCFNMSSMLQQMGESAVISPPLSRADERDPAEVFHKGRNFR